MTNKDGFVETALLNQPKNMTSPKQIKIFKYQSAYGKVDSVSQQQTGEEGPADDLTMTTF